MPAIGSAAWNEELAAIGLDRAAVDAKLEHGHTAPIDGLRRALALDAAAGVLSHERAPSYAFFLDGWNSVMLDAHHCGHDVLVDWMVRQLAAMIQHGRPEVAASADYTLGVDHFEDPRRARLVVPRLVALMDDTWRAEFLARSGYVDWVAKRAFYLEWAREPARHDAVADALARSIHSGFFATVDATEGLDLLALLQIDAARRDPIREQLTRPIEAWVAGALALTRPLPRGGDVGLLLGFRPNPLAPAPAPYHGVPSWFVGAELWFEARSLGQVESARASLEPDNLRFATSRMGELRRGRIAKLPASYDTRCEWHLLRSAGDTSGEILDLVEEPVEFRPRAAISRPWRRLRAAWQAQ